MRVCVCVCGWMSVLSVSICVYMVMCICLHVYISILFVAVCVCIHACVFVCVCVGGGGGCLFSVYLNRTLALDRVTDPRKAPHSVSIRKFEAIVYKQAPFLDCGSHHGGQALPMLH